MNQPMLLPEIDRLRELVRKLAPFVIEMKHTGTETLPSIDDLPYKVCQLCSGESHKGWPLPDDSEVRHETECQLRPYVDTCSDND